MRIGFLDYYLNNFHANKFHGLLRGAFAAKLQEAAGAPVELAAGYETDSAAGGAEDWCAAKGVKRAASLDDFLNSVDAVICMAPDNPELHLQLATPVLRVGKPLFLDKSLAHSVADAKAILDLAASTGTPLYSASSLRYSTELNDLVDQIAGRKAESIFSRGLGEWRGYACHLLGPALRLAGEAVTRVIDTGAGDARLVTLETVSGRKVAVEMRHADNEYEATPYTLGALVDGNYLVTTVSNYDDLYANVLLEAVKFFAGKKSPLSPQEMLQPTQIEEAVEASREQGSVWVTLH